MCIVRIKLITIKGLGEVDFQGYSMPVFAWHICVDLPYVIDKSA